MRLLVQRASLIRVDDRWPAAFRIEMLDLRRKREQAFACRKNPSRGRRALFTNRRYSLLEEERRECDNESSSYHPRR